MASKVNVRLTMSPATRRVNGTGGGRSNFVALPAENAQFSLEDSDGGEAAVTRPRIDPRIFTARTAPSRRCEQFYSNPVFDTVYSNEDEPTEGAARGESSGLLDGAPAAARRNPRARLAGEPELSLDANNLAEAAATAAAASSSFSGDEDSDPPADAYDSEDDDDDLDLLPASLSSTFPTGGPASGPGVGRRLQALVAGSAERVRRLIRCCWPTSAAKCNFL